MQDCRLQFDDVWKKFRLGERNRSLRDAIPAFAKGLFRKQKNSSNLEGDEFYSLSGVSFAAHAGECVGIIGPNGAGKSTLLKCASKILRPNRGKVNVKGRVCALIEVGAGFHPDLTGRENIFLNGVILGMKKKEVEKRFDQIVEFSGMEDFIDTPVKRYSSGMYARLGFSVAAFMDPDVLLIDEVLSVGDMAFSYKCQKRIEEILATDAAVVFISHNLAAVRSLCSRIVVLNGGKVCFDGKPEEAIHIYHDLLSKGDNSGQCHPAIRHLKLSLGNELGEPTFSSKPGSMVCLDAEVTAAQRIREASLGFFVCNEQDVEVYACSTESLGQENVDLEAGQTIRTRFWFSANLVPGTYWIGSILHGRPEGGKSGRETIDRNPNRVQLTIAGPIESQGSANLFASCESDIAVKEMQLEAVR